MRHLTGVSLPRVWPNASLEQVCRNLAEERVRSQVSAKQLTLVRNEVTKPLTLAEGIHESISSQDHVDQILSGDGDEPNSGGHVVSP